MYGIIIIVCLYPLTRRKFILEGEKTNMNIFFKKSIAAVSAAAMVGSLGLVPITVSAATHSDQAIDLSKFDKGLEYDSTTETASITLGPLGNQKGAWSKLDLKPYTQYDGEQTKKVTISYKETVPSGGRSSIAFYDDDLANYSINTYQDITGAPLLYGVLGSNTSKIMYLNADKQSGKFSVDTEENVTLVYDLENKKISGNIGSQTIPETSFSGTYLNFDSVDTMGIYSWSTMTYKISDMKITTVTSVGTYYTVLYNVNNVTSSETVQEGNSPTKVPTDTAKTGYIFKGWSTDGSSEYDASKTYVSSEEILASKVTGAVTYTAVYEKDADYIEAMDKIEFSTVPSGNLLTAGADENTAADNNFEIKITGELGSDITASPDSRVTDYKVEYTLKGFNWKSHDKQPTSDSTEWPYCDSYGKLVTNGATADFQLKNHSFNYYGQLVAKVTYNGKTLETSTPIAYIGNPQANTNTNQILPRGGYYEDANAYSPDMVGYVAATSSNNITASDVVTDNWAAYGGNTKNVSIQEENGSKFFRLEAFGTKSSSFAVTRIDSVKDSQVVFDQMVRFHNAKTAILLKTANPVTWNDTATTFSALFDNGKLSLNGSEICDAATGIWYRVLITSDVTSGKCYAEVYSEDGTKLGASEIVNFTNAGSTNPTYYGYRTPDNSKGKCDFNKVTVKRAVLDESTIATTSTADTIAIPEAGKPSVSETLNIDAKTTDGLPAIGKAEWSIADETITGVTITPSEEDSHTATVTVAEGASAGELPINVTIAGKTKTINLTLSSSQDSLKFTESSSSVSIPLSSTETSVNTYKAVVINGDGEEIAGKDVTYALYDSKNANPISTPAGVTFENGVLTVTSEAKPVTLYVRATSTNTQNETITKAIKVTIHGLSFDFGLDSEDALADGYTAVTPSTTYNAKLGFGIEGSATAGGEASVDNADSDYLEGSYTFKVNVENNKLYNVTLNYEGNAVFENISKDLSGVIRSNASMGSATYSAFVNDGVLDITFDKKVSSILIEKVEKDEAVKPNVYTIGDSTIANNGSWAYVLARDFGNYTELGNYITFSSNGQGGTNLSSYYSKGSLWDRVVSKIRPGDYVMIGDMGTNGVGEDFKGTFNYYIDACLARGAKVILNSYTPHGAIGNYASGYNKDTQTFDSYRKDTYDNIVRAIYEERKSELSGFVDIGKNADTAFNAYVDDYAANGYESRDAAAQAIIGCFGDHNHYSNGSLAAKLMIEGYNGTPGIVSELTKLVAPKVPDVTVTSIGDFTSGSGDCARAYKGEFTGNGITVSTITWTVKSQDGKNSIQKSGNLLSVSGNSTYVAGLIVTADDLNKIGDVSAELK